MGEFRISNAMTRSDAFRGLATGIVGLALAISFVACSDPSSDPTVTGSDYAKPDSADVFGQGSPIAEGFSVPDGDLLLMAPIPRSAAEQGDQAWTAYLRPKDPIATFVALATQASQLGFEMYGSAPDPCYAEPDERTLGDNERPKQGAPFPDGVEAIRVECQALGTQLVRGVEEQVFIHTVQDLRSQQPIASAELSWERMPEGVASQEINSGRLGLKTLKSRAPLPDSPVDMAPPEMKVGDPLSSWDGTSGFTLLEGSRLVAPVNEKICQGGFRAALDITGDPEKVFASYVDRLTELAAEYGRPPKVSSSTLFERRVQQAITNIDDGTMATVTMAIGGKDEPVRLLLDVCGG